MKSLLKVDVIVRLARHSMVGYKVYGGPLYWHAARLDVDTS